MSKNWSSCVGKSYLCSPYTCHHLFAWLYFWTCHCCNDCLLISLAESQTDNYQLTISFSISSRNFSNVFSLVQPTAFNFHTSSFPLIISDIIPFLHSSGPISSSCFIFLWWPLSANYLLPLITPEHIHFQSTYGIS